MKATLCSAVLLGLFLVLGCAQESQPSPKDTPQSAKKAQSSQPPSPKKKKAPSTTTTTKLELPAASRVFTADLDGDGFHEVLGARGKTLWAYQIHKSGGISKLWEIEGEGTTHRVVIAQGAEPKSRRLYVARGVGRGMLGAPLLLQSVVPMSGLATEVFKRSGERNEPAHLSVADVDRDGADELAFAYYQSKYMVVTRHFELSDLQAPPSGKSPPSAVGKEMRMATSRLYADVNGAGGGDEVIGRVYGDARGLPGDLKVDLGQGYVTVPTDNGVRGLAAASVVKGEAPSIFYADGWVANYGKSAKATLKRLSWTANGFSSEVVGQSKDEFTFFDLTPVDLDGDGREAVAARGNKRMTIFELKEGRWRQWTAATYEPVINVAIGQGGDGLWRVFVPGEAGVRGEVVKRP